VSDLPFFESATSSVTETRLKSSAATIAVTAGEKGSQPMNWGLIAFEGVETPPDNQVIWRYLSFFSFVELVHTKKLRFHRADKFKDPLEGTFTEREWAERQTKGRLSNLERLTMLMRQFSFVSCWRQGEEESSAMWELYNRGEGTVAIKSTVGQLKEILRSRPQMSCVGSVKYINRSTHAEEEVGQSIVFRKDRSYDFENEVRAVLLDPNEWGYHRGLNMAGQPWADQVVEQIQQLYQRIENVTPAELESPEMTSILDGFLGSGVSDDFQTGIEIEDLDLTRLVTEVVIAPAVEPVQSRSRLLVESVAKDLGFKITSSNLMVKPY
jgi:hypothetical protein